MSNVPSAIADAPFEISSTPTESELLAKYFRVFADQSRLRILEALEAEGELSVGDLVERLGLPQPSVSNHLACLRWCGFVTTRREHRTVHNRIADRKVSRVIALARELLSRNAEHVAACRRIDGGPC
jgi:ArsR family transcriptional regulator, cadmium/lead-responsive transcriptional repressor